MASVLESLVQILWDQNSGKYELVSFQRRKLSLDVLHDGKSVQPAPLQNTLPLLPPCPPIWRKRCRPTGPEELSRWMVLSGEKPPPAVMKDINKLWSETRSSLQDVWWPRHCLLSVLALVSFWSHVWAVLAPLPDTSGFCHALYQASCF